MHSIVHTLFGSEFIYSFFSDRPDHSHRPMWPKCCVQVRVCVCRACAMCTAYVLWICHHLPFALSLFLDWLIVLYLGLHILTFNQNAYNTQCGMFRLWKSIGIYTAYLYSFFHSFQMCLHEFFTISFLSVFLLKFRIHNNWHWKPQWANFSIKIYIIRCIDVFNWYERERKGNRLINRNDSNSHARISSWPEIYECNHSTKAMTMYTKQAIKRMQQRNGDIDILSIPTYEVFQSLLNAVLL